MKSFFVSTLLIPIFTYSQLKLEWKKEFTDGEGAITAIAFSEGNIFTSHSNRTYMHTQSGEVIKDLGESSGTLEMEFAGDTLFLFGGTLLKSVSLNGELVSQYNLTDENGSPNWLNNGCIAGKSLYTAHQNHSLIKYNLQGEILLVKKTAELPPTKFLKIGGQYLYLYCEAAYDNRLIQYDTLGNQNWTILPGAVNNILADKAGNCYGFIRESLNSNIVSKYNSSGELIWSKEVSGQVRKGYLFEDSLLICGTDTIANGDSRNPSFSILSANDGKLIYRQKFDFYPSESYETFTQIATDGKAVYLGGQTGGQSPINFLVKISREGNTTGIEYEKNSKSGFNIFPNPGGSKFTISCDESTIATLDVKIRNGLGQVVHKKEINCEGQKSWDLDLSGLKSGNYTIEISSANENTVKKIIVE